MCNKTNLTKFRQGEWHFIVINIKLCGPFPDILSKVYLVGFIFLSE